MPGWPERVKTMQANWIGKSQGVRFAFTHDIRGRPTASSIGDGRMYVFTTRADTIMGVTFCAVAAEHPLAAHAAKSNPKLAAFIDECKRGSVMEADLATMEKKGMPTGLFVTHPLTGEKVEVWVGNYVLMAYGDGAVMGVPAHDERDFAFAQKYGLPIQQVIRWIDARGGGRADRPFSTDAWQPWYADNGACMCNSGKYDGLALRRRRRRDRRRSRGARASARRRSRSACATGASRASATGARRSRSSTAPRAATCRCRRQDLPVVLPEDCVPDGSRQSAREARRLRRLARARNAAGPAKRETDTMDTFVDSSWYYMRYACPDAPTMVDARNDYWNPMDQYIGGIEHAILHLLYARFWTKVMRDMGLVRMDEPFTRLLTQGMVLNHIYFRRTEKGGIDYFRAGATSTSGTTPTAASPARRLKADGQPVEYGGVGTMSKSQAERRRSAGHDRPLRRRRRAAVRDVRRRRPRTTLVWSDAGVEGAHRFLRRLWTFAQAQRRRRAVAPRPRSTARDAAAAVKAARREIHLDAEAGELRLRADPVQHGRVRRHEDAERARGRARRRRGRARARCAKACRS